MTRGYKAHVLSRNVKIIAQLVSVACHSYQYTEALRS